MKQTKAKPNDLDKKKRFFFYFYFFLFLKRVNLFLTIKPTQAAVSAGWVRVDFFFFFFTCPKNPYPYVFISSGFGRVKGSGPIFPCLLLDSQ